MSHKGHRHNYGRSTSLEIYNDASQILEKLLAKHNDESLRVPHKAQRNRTGSVSIRVKTGNVADRSKIGYFRQSRSLDSALEITDLNFLLKNTDEQNNETRPHGGSQPSLDTDYEELQAIDQRKKKSIFKRAKERLRHSFNHQNQEIDRTINKSSNSSSVFKGQKKKSKQRKHEMDETNPKMDVDAGEDRSVEHKDTKIIAGSIHTEKLSIKKEKVRSIAFTSALVSLLTGKIASFHSIKKGHALVSLKDTNGNSRKKADRTKYVPGEGLPSSHQESFTTSVIDLPLPPPPPPPPPPLLPEFAYYKTPEKYSKLSPPPGGYHPGSSEDTYSNTQSNSLDSPGEDIEYIDDDPSEIGSSTGIVNRLTDQSSGGIPSHHVTDKRGFSPQRPGPNIETPTAVNSTIVSDNPQEAEYEELPFQSQQESDSQKELIYARIAEKLIQLGDLCSMSDQELEGAAASNPPILSDLEKEIIACLRTGGDRYSKQMDVSFEEVTQQTTQEAYQRFHSTMKNSVGSELSWNHLAFLFYTTKGVVSAVGTGSRSASRAKEFTLQYISDTFASWIMDQGGFKSVLSSDGSGSDFDVD